MGLPGSTSNRDLDFLIQSVPNLKTSPGGNELLLELYEVSHQLKVDTMNEQRRIIQENGGVPPIDLEDRLNNFVESNFRLPEGLQERIEAFEPDSNVLLNDAENNAIDDIVNVAKKREQKEETPSQRLANRDKRKLGE
jgi:hypothetical protein